MAHRFAAALRVLALLLVLAAPIAHATSVWSSSWDQAAMQSDNHCEKADTERMCLRMVSLDECGVLGFFAASYFKTGMDCCPEYGGDYRGPSDGMFSSSRLAGWQVGKCVWRYELVVEREYITGALDTEMLGMFNLQCDLTARAEKCAEGLCGDMILEAEGPLYRVNNTAIKAPIPDIHLNGCKSLTLGGRMVGGVLAPDHSFLVPRQPMSAHKASKVETANVGYDAYLPGTSYVVSGPVRVSSKFTELKYEAGYMQAVVQSTPSGSTYIQPSQGQFIADTYRVDLLLKQKREFRY